MKQVKKIFLFPLVLFSLANTNAIGGELDMLLDRLVDKGVLTGYEAQEVRYGTEEEIKRQISLGTHKTLPYWLQNIALGGDIRVRYQKEDNNNLNYIRHRIRQRVRLSLNAKINGNVFTYAGIATGDSPDPRSTNQTFTGNFIKKSIYLDYAYFEYYPIEWFSISGGKIKQAFWTSNDMLWDTDINQEGGLFKIEKIFDSSITNSIYAGGFLLRENKDFKDQYLRHFSNILSYRSDNSLFKANVGLTYYDFINLKSTNTLSNRPDKNHYQEANRTIGNKYVYNYRPFVIDAEVSKNIENPISLYMLNISNLSLFSSYVKNTAISSSKNNKGWIAGLRLGQERVSGPWDFQLSYSRRWLEADAWLDCHPDSDFYGGSTDVKGDEFIFTLGLGRDFSITADYYQSKPIKNNKKEEKLFQLDVNLKF